MNLVPALIMQQLRPHRLHRQIVQVFLLVVSVFGAGVKPASAELQCSDLYSRFESIETLPTLIKNQPFPVPPVVVRGFTRPGYGARELVEMIFGNRQHELRSWALEKVIKEINPNGEIPENDLERADARIKVDVAHQLQTYGYATFYEQQMKASYVGLKPEQKSSSVLFAAPISTDTALGYARFAFWKLAQSLNYPKNLRSSAIVLEIDTNKVPVIAKETNFEYMIISRIDSAGINGAYIGYPHYQGESFAPRGIDYDWYYIKVNRNALGEAVSIEIHEAREESKGIGLALRSPIRPLAIIDRNRVSTRCLRT